MGDHSARHLATAGETVHEGGCLPGGGDGHGNDVEMVIMVIIMLKMMTMEDSVYQVILPSFQVHTSSSRY